MTSREKAIKALGRRAFVASACTLLLGAAAQAVAQPETYPSRPLRLVVPHPPGGFTDMLARLLSERLSARLGQPVVVDNKTGGGSVVGTSTVASAAPDGYTALVVAVDHAINVTLMPKVPYDAVKDFTPVIRAAFSPMLLVAHPSMSANSLKEFITLAKSNPGKINFASAGIGSGAHLAMELFRHQAAIDIVHVPYRGNGPATADLLSGQVSAMFLQAGVAKPLVEAGRIKVLATPSPQRLTLMPDVPTMAESGMPDFQVRPWFGIMAPAGTPGPIVNRLNAELDAVLRQPDVAKRLADQGASYEPNSSAEFTAFLSSEIGRWGDIVKVSGARVD